MAFIEASDYRFTYPDRTEYALAIDDFSMEKGSFCLLTGESGSGKSTWIRQLSGNTALAGSEEGYLRTDAKKIACVWQDPESQIVTDRVEYEIVFGMENDGMDRAQMGRRLAEVVTFFGLEEMLGRDTMRLSGGEMQILNVAAAVARNPEVLLLDEPAGQLDPVAVRRLYALLRQINEELGITIIMAEQRLEDALPLADRMVVLRMGRIAADGSPAEVFSRWNGDAYSEICPSYVRLFKRYGGGSVSMPLSRRESRQWFEANFAENGRTPEYTPGNGGSVTECKNVFFRYKKELPDVLGECCFSFSRGAVTCIAGGNGSGKTTLLKILSGRLRPYRGKIKNMPENTAVLPQQPMYLFLEDTVREECKKGGRAMEELAEYFDLSELRDSHPADLSGGEAERLALCMILSEDCELYLLDEPTNGLDGAAKKKLAQLLRRWKEEGKTIVMASHDMEFAASCADNMALMFRGRVELEAETRRFFEENAFYTTGINRMARGVSRHIITEEDVDAYAKKKGD